MLTTGLVVTCAPNRHREWMMDYVMYEWTNKYSTPCCIAGSPGIVPLFYKAHDKFVWLMEECKKGFGCDRHLMGIALQAAVCFVTSKPRNPYYLRPFCCCFSGNGEPSSCSFFWSRICEVWRWRKFCLVNQFYWIFRRMFTFVLRLWRAFQNVELMLFIIRSGYWWCCSNGG